MDRRKPLCRNDAVHGSHGYWTHSYTSWNECPGWSEQEADTAALAGRLDQVAREAAWSLRMSAGIRLECHPSVPYALQQFFIPSYSEFAASLKTGEDMMKPQLPVVVTAGMTVGQWRIVADDGQIAEGAIRHG